MSQTLLVGVLAALTAVAGAQTRFTVTEIGVLPGTDTSFATNINARGQVVGACNSSTGINDTAFLWENGALKSLGRLQGGTFSDATALNSLGVVVGDGDTGNGRPQSWVNTPSGLLNIFPNNGGNTHAIGINDSGVICGYYTKSLSGRTGSWRGALWTPDPKDPRKYRTIDLPILMGNDATVSTALPFGFNQSGQATGYAVNDIIGQHACFWNNDAKHTVVDLGTLPGGWSSIAWGVNDLGQAVGYSYEPFTQTPMMWDNDAAHTPIVLPLLPGDNWGSAQALNNKGKALGTSGTYGAATSRLVLWSGGQVYDLQSSLDETTGAGWTLLTTTAINDAGQIVGLGTHNGLVRGYVLTPIP